MEEKLKVSKKNVALKWGTVSGLIGIVIFVLQDFMGMAGNQTFGWAVMLLSFAIGVTILIMAQREFINTGDGFMGYGEGLGIGVLMALISSAISSVFAYVYVSFINTGYAGNIKEMQIMEMEKKGMTDAQIEQGMQILEMFISPTGMLFTSLSMGIFFEFLLALVVSAFTKKPRPKFE